MHQEKIIANYSYAKNIYIQLSSELIRAVETARMYRLAKSFSNSVSEVKVSNIFMTQGQTQHNLAHSIAMRDAYPGVVSSETCLDKIVFYV